MMLLVLYVMVKFICFMPTFGIRNDNKIHMNTTLTSFNYE